MLITTFRLCRNPKAKRSGVGLLRFVQASDVQSGNAIVQDSDIQSSDALVQDSDIQSGDALVQAGNVQSGDAQKRKLECKFEWVRPLKRDLTSATYELHPGFYVLVTDDSSHRNDRKIWTIIQVIQNEEGKIVAVVREEAKVWRANKTWGCYWWGKKGKYELIAQIAAEHKGCQATDMSVIEILNAFFECAILRLKKEQAEQAKSRRDEPPSGG